MRSVKALALAPSEKETSSAEARLESPCVPFDIQHQQGHYELGQYENLSFNEYTGAQYPGWGH